MVSSAIFFDGDILSGKLKSPRGNRKRFEYNGNARGMSPWRMTLREIQMTAFIRFTKARPRKEEEASEALYKSSKRTRFGEIQR
ncbi:hypothetical protein CEXT_87101 [Caerostris extrusa]|uniref:Uncharacterized protein n=1 Tax=Caerostris extrusa TaxID=172846 RepID=A0AAV4T9S8_CAEEX|nr:hypothetical protein CEXT_87101 [Caerostris extrusa]